MADTTQTETPVACAGETAAAVPEVAAVQVPMITIDAPTSDAPCDVSPIDVDKQTIEEEETGEKTADASDPAIVNNVATSSTTTHEEEEEEEEGQEKEKNCTSMLRASSASVMAITNLVETSGEKEEEEEEERKCVTVVVEDADVAQLDPAREADSNNQPERFSFIEESKQESLTCTEVMDASEGEQVCGSKRKLEGEVATSETTDAATAVKVASQASPKRQKVEEEAMLTACGKKGMTAESGGGLPEGIEVVAEE